MCTLWKIPGVYLFASKLNHKVETYCSLRPDPGARYINAFTFNWTRFECIYIFCPFSLINSCIRKIISYTARAILIVPLWTTQLWFPVLLRILVGYPRLLPASKTLLQLKHLHKKHSVGKKVDYDSMSCLRRSFRSQRFSKKATAIFPASWRRQLSNDIRVTVVMFL